MTLTTVCKAVAAAVLGLSLIGGFFVADKASKETRFYYDYRGDLQEYTDQNDIAYTVALFTTWTAGGILTLFVYGIGVIVEELRQGNTYKLDILKEIESRHKDNT